MNFNPQTYHETFNLVEGWFWITLAILIPLIFHKQTSGLEKAGLVIAFVAFGISDFIEIKTGAWYRPWPLFLLKAVCLISIIILMARIWIATKHHKP